MAFGNEIPKNVAPKLENQTNSIKPVKNQLNRWWGIVFIAAGYCLNLLAHALDCPIRTDCREAALNIVALVNIASFVMYIWGLITLFSKQKKT